MKTLLGKSMESILSMNIFFIFVKSIFSCDCIREKLKMSSINNDSNILFLCALAQVSSVKIMF